jgi:hypothetical protein
MSGQLRVPAALPPEMEPPAPILLEGWVGSRAILDAVARDVIPAAAGNEPQSSIPLSDHYIELPRLPPDLYIELKYSWACLMSSVSPNV